MDVRRTGILAVAGCAAACAGIGLVPVLLGGAGAGVAAITGDTGLAAVIAVVAGGAYLWLWLWRRGRQACACAPDAGCAPGNGGAGKDSTCALSNGKGAG